jgi:hypothetical protein
MSEQPKIDAYTPALSGEGATAPEPYSARVRCKSCENGSGPNGCTDCLNTGHDPMAFAGGIDGALNDAYAEGRKDEAETQSQAARDVLAERQRQISDEYWTPEHDDTHRSGAMAAGAGCYALWAASQAGNNDHWNAEFQYRAQRLWQWDAEWFKPKDARRNLVRAGALILAEIERLDRATGSAS